MSDQHKNEKFAQLRRLAEALLKQRGSTSIEVPDNFAEIVHELEVYQIELEMQHIELQRAYEALEKSRQQYSDLFDFAPTGYFITDRDGEIIKCNLTMAVMLSTERDKLIGAKFSSFLQGEDKETYYIHRRAVIRTLAQQTCEVRLVRHDRTELFVYLNTEAMSTDGDTCLTSVTDISHIKQAEYALQRALYREKELNSLKSRLIEVISHELRTPLSTILSSVDMLDKYGDMLEDVKKKQRYDRIRTYVWYLNDVINDVMIAHRSYDESPRLHVASFDVIVFIHQLVDDLALIEGTNGRIVCKVFGTQAEEIVTWDKNLFRRIVTNLLQNALKYSSASVQCELACEDQTVILTVQDLGPGIPEADQPYIFNIFYRGSNTISVPGTGVGLKLVQYAVEAHHGSIQFTSSKEGTTFVVKLPRHVKVSPSPSPG